MRRNLEKEHLKASASSPVDTKQKDDGRVENQTTMVPKKRKPYTTIIIIIAFILMIAILVTVLQTGTA